MGMILKVRGLRIEFWDSDILRWEEEKDSAMELEKEQWVREDD